MRKGIHLSIALLSFPFLAGFKTTGVKFCNLSSDSIIGPFTVGVDCSGTVIFTPKKSGAYRIYLEFESGNSGGVKTFPSLPIGKTYSPSKSGSITFSIDGDWIADTGNTLTFTARCTSGTYNGSVYTNTAYLDGAGKVYSDCQPGTSYKGASRWLYFEYGDMMGAGNTYTATGWNIEQYSDGRNYLHFFDKPLTVYSRMLDYTRSMSGDFTLRSNDNLNDFSIGSADSRYRYFPLTYKAEEGSYTSNFTFCLDGSNYLDLRNLHMLDYANTSEACVATDRLFIPAGLGKAGTEYSFTLILSDLYGFGDYLSYELSYTRLYENMGSGLDSNYKVVGGSL